MKNGAPSYVFKKGVNFFQETSKTVTITFDKDGDKNQ